MTKPAPKSKAKAAVWVTVRRLTLADGTVLNPGDPWLKGKPAEWLTQRGHLTKETP